MPTRRTTNCRRHNYHTTYRTTTRRTPTTTTTYTCNSPKFRTVQQECQWRMGSYRNVYNQFTGTGRKTVFSPTTANRWMRYVNNGVQVYKFTNQDFCRYFGSRWARSTSRAAYTYLNNHFGTSIKDVTRGKGNCWLIAATRTPTARPFANYIWR